MHVVRRGHIDRINVLLFFIQEFSPVTVLSGVGQLLSCLIEIIFVDIADCHDVNLSCAKN